MKVFGENLIDFSKRLEMAQKTCDGHCNATCFFCKQMFDETPRPSRIRPFPEPYPDYLSPERKKGMSDTDMRQARARAHVDQYEAWKQWK